ESVKDISQTDLNDLIKTAVWKPDKDNKSGLTPKPFLYETPKPGERFEYVVVENDLLQKIGDRMEYLEVTRQLGKKTDISYYLNSVVSLCACFINYKDIYQLPPEAMLEALKKLKNKQEGMTDIVIDDYRFLQQHGHNGKG
ncbi:18269_t:CDS:2, partial [Funneliformis geosporum]